MEEVLRWYFDGTRKPMDEFEPFVRGWNAAIIWLPIMKKRAEARGLRLSREELRKLVLDTIYSADGLSVRDIMERAVLSSAAVRESVGFLADEGSIEIGEDRRLRASRARKELP